MKVIVRAHCGAEAAYTRKQQQGHDVVFCVVFEDATTKNDNEKKRQRQQHQRIQKERIQEERKY